MLRDVLITHSTIEMRRCQLPIRIGLTRRGGSLICSSKLTDNFGVEQKKFKRGVKSLPKPNADFSVAIRIVESRVQN